MVRGAIASAFDRYLSQELPMEISSASSQRSAVLSLIGPTVPIWVERQNVGRRTALALLHQGCYRGCRLPDSYRPELSPNSPA